MNTNSNARLTATNVTKTLEIVDNTGTVKGNYNGYQVTLTEDALKTLSEGDYRLQLRIKHVTIERL